MIRNANTNATNSLGYPPIFNAIDSGNIKAIKMLIDAGADLNYVNNEINPIWHAIAVKNKIALKLLLKNGAIVNNSNTQQNHLALASLHSTADIISLLIKYGGNIKVADPRTGMTILHIMVYYKKTEVVSLIENGEFDEILEYTEYDKGYTALHIASERGFNDASIALLKAGAVINVIAAKSDEPNTTPLSIAYTKKNYTLFRILLDHGANIILMHPIYVMIYIRTILYIKIKSIIESNY